MPNIRKTIILLLLGLGLIFTLSACHHSNPQSSRPKITVSILPQKYFLEKIAGNRFQIQVMIPPGASPATYDPTPRQILDMAQSDIYFEIGHLVFEETRINNKKSEFDKVIFINSSKGLNLTTTEGEHSDHKQSLDPHIWMSPKNVTVIAQNMTGTLVSKYPETKDFFEANLKIFMKELDSLDGWIKNELSDIQNRRFIIYHPALTYYAKDYGLQQIPMEWEGKEPSPLYLKDLIKSAEEDQIKAIFIQKQFNTSEAETLSRETGTELIPIDPLSYEWEAQLKYITNELARALK